MLDRIGTKGCLTDINTDRLIKDKTNKYSRITGERVFDYKIPSLTGKDVLELRIREKSNKIQLRGNLRKWRFGNSIVADLNFGDYIETIEMLSNILSVDIQYLWDLEFTSLEIGGNVKLPAIYSGVEHEIVSLGKLSRGRFKNTVYFNGEKHGYKFYDKTKEHKKLKKRSKKKIKKAFHMLRIEEKIKSKSGVPKKDKIMTLGAIRDNWDYLIDDWAGIIDRTNLKEGKKELAFMPNSMTRLEIKDQLVRKRIKNKGIEKTIDYCIKNFNGKPSVIRKYIMEIYNTVIKGSEYIDYYDIKKYIDLKADEMKCRTPKKWNY